MDKNIQVTTKIYKIFGEKKRQDFKRIKNFWLFQVFDIYKLLINNFCLYNCLIEKKNYYLFKQGTNPLKDKKNYYVFYKFFCLINRKNGRVGAHAMHVHRLFPLFN